MRLAVLVLLLATGCCSPAPAADVPEPQPASQPGASPQPAASADASAGSSAELPPLHAPGAACKLEAPKLSGDPCEKDDDCGVSEPCHAPACVAKAKSNPPQPGTMCTMSLLCHTADANRCGCHQGQCALIPPADK